MPATIDSNCLYKMKEACESERIAKGTRHLKYEKKAPRKANKCQSQKGHTVRSPMSKSRTGCLLRVPQVSKSSRHKIVPTHVKQEREQS